MIDWKGTKVKITIVRGGYPAKTVRLIRTTLDTDTLLDLFSQYDPKTHKYTIRPNR